LADLPQAERDGVQAADQSKPSASLTSNDLARLREVCKRIAARADPKQPVFIAIQEHPEQSLAHVLQSERLLDNTHIKQALAVKDEDGRLHIELHLTEEGSGLFEQITGENMKRRLAIVFDRSVLMAPLIQEKISSGVLRVPVPLQPDADLTQASQHTLAFLMGMLPLPAKPEVQTGLE
jgi:preprotein translocase subunit SecD